MGTRKKEWMRRDRGEARAEVLLSRQRTPAAGARAHLGEECQRHEVLSVGVPLAPPLRAAPRLRG